MSEKSWEEKLSFIKNKGITLYSWFAHWSDDYPSEEEETIIKGIIALIEKPVEIHLINGILSIVDSYEESPRRAILFYLTKWALGNIQPHHRIMTSTCSKGDAYLEIFEYLDGWYNMYATIKPSEYILFAGEEEKKESE